MAEELTDKVYDIKRVSDRIVLIKLLICDEILSVLSVYAPQTGLEDSIKDTFYDNLLSMTSDLPDNEIVIPCGDWNGHVGKVSAGYEGVHGGHGYGTRNDDGDRILDFAVANDFVIGNTFFEKRNSHLITYQSGPSSTQIDFILLRKQHLKLVKDIKVIPNEECVPQHKLVTCDVCLKISKYPHKPFIPRSRKWKLLDTVIKSQFEQSFSDKINNNTYSNSTIEEIWAKLKNTLLETAEEVCGKTKKPLKKRETWWWNNEVKNAVCEKRRLWKIWSQKGGSKEEYY